MEPTEHDTTHKSAMTFGDRYRAIRVIGEGTFGWVYEGYDPTLKRKIAIKVPKPRAEKGSAERTQKYLDEALNLAKLQHPGIVSVFDVGVQNGKVYIVTEFLEGPTLYEYISSKSIGPNEAAKLVANLASALGHAHTQMVVHRDVKPGNVIMTKDRGPVLVDFGLAIAEDNDGSQIGDIMGTVQYMAPEQIEGQAHRIDGRTDIYALGVLMYQLLTNRVPFRSSNKNEIRRQILQDDPQPLRQLAPDVPEALQRICLRAMSRTISKRYSTGQDLADRLNQFLATHTKSDSSEEFYSENEGDNFAPTRQLDHADRMNQSGMDPTDESTYPNPAAKSSESADSDKSTSGSQGSGSTVSGRRHVTVLRINAVARCQDSAGMDPDDQIEVLDELQKAVSEKAEAYGGSILYRGGQEFSVCFGYPLSYEDAPRRATDMALDINNQFRGRQKDVFGSSNIQLDLWLSVHSGMIVVMGGDAQNLVGDVLSLVSKIDRETQPNEVVVSEDTLRLVGHYFDTQRLAATCGLRDDQPKSLHRVRGRRQESISETIDDKVQQTPLVGRDQEVSMLIDRWELTSEGVGQLVALIGEAGLGKSRLIQIIKQHVTQQFLAKDKSAPILEWQCSPYHSASAFQPVKESIVRWLDLDPESTGEERRLRVDKHLKSIGMSRTDSLPILLELLSLPADPQLGAPKIASSKKKELTITVILKWIMCLAEQQPLLFIIEDLHWIDPSTLEILSRIADQPMDSPCLCLQTFRPEFTTPWTSRAHQSQIALNRLTRAQATQIIQSRLGDGHIAKGTIARIIERTDGIPLFVEEYAKMLAESGEAADEPIGDSHGSSLLTARSSDEIPSSLQDLLTARLDRAGGDQGFVRLAATIGREFSYEMIRAVAQLDDVTLKRELAILTDAEILYRRGSLPECTFQFKHALIQDAAYESMLRRQRQEFHHRIADVIVRRFPETMDQRPEVLAYHFTRAGVHREAARWWEMAGAAAVANGVFVEAIEHLKAGLELIERLPESTSRDELELKINISLGIAILSIMGYASPDLESIYDRRSVLCQQLDDPMAQLHALWAKGSWRIVRDDVMQCIAIGQKIRQMAEQINDDGARAEALFIDAIGRFYHAEFDSSRQLTEKGMQLFDAEKAIFHLRRTGQHAGVAHLCYLSLNQWHLGQPKSAIESMRKGLELAESLDHPFSVAFALHHHSWLSVSMGRGDEAVSMADRQIEVSQQQAFFFWETTGMLFRAGGLLCIGDTQAANETLDEAIQRYQMTGARLATPLYMSFVASAKRQVGDLAASEDAILRGLEAANTFEDNFALPELWRQKAHLAESRKDRDQVAECFLKSVAISRDHQAVSDELASWLHVHRWLKQSDQLSIGGSSQTSCSIEDVQKTIETLRGQIEATDFDIPVLKSSSD
ncbi:protein kinase domain-containing protein [Novipirellula sp. SH528]|uniref:protein kinase domain-containing protein n=1 Tax=Novipirellula sp. SH528 TaxID=3454466 RepID=UPI003F9EFD7F